MRTAPWFDDLHPGDVLDDAPGLTLTSGHAAVHQAICGDRLRLPLDTELALRVAGGTDPVAHPQLVCDVAIGQSTQVTQRVIANLFYRGLVLHRLVRIGDTLRTTTTVEQLKENRRRPDRAPSGLAVLRMRTEDQEGRTVLDFRRCAMLPLSPNAEPTAWTAELTDVPDALSGATMATLAGTCDLSRFREASPHGVHLRELELGQRWTVTAGDVVSSAPELARLSLNVAGAHHDAGAAGGRRLVYGGHTIGVAAAQLARLVPNLVTIAGWERCDHLGPVYEGDTLRSSTELTGIEPLSTGGGLARFRVQVVAVGDHTQAEPPEREVLDWRLVGVMA